MSDFVIKLPDDSTVPLKFTPVQRALMADMDRRIKNGELDWLILWNKRRGYFPESTFDADRIRRLWDKK